MPKYRQYERKLKGTSPLNSNQWKSLSDQTMILLLQLLPSDVIIQKSIKLILTADETGSEHCASREAAYLLMRLYASCYKGGRPCVSGLK